ncbi:helix-turn-helix domain-containing protein [Brassicibacter mesophilus]|uniref:helix-turn-helix domain-containing protein n=1 Tax=Brassicibacter mesophilus TaxID=745119 RepID=UPI003D1B7A1A
MEKELGNKIKELRTSQNLTLKDLSEKTNLSIGYISQLERGLTSVAISTLGNIAEALGVELSYFFSAAKVNNKRIIRSYEQEVTLVENGRFIHHDLANNIECKDFTPVLKTILPTYTDEVITPYTHNGEEFIYVLEGILTIFIENERHDIYPGDSIHINSNTPHNWCNYTNKIVKILSVNSTNA